MAVKAVLWDIDGTLLDFDKTERYGIQKCFEIFELGACSEVMLRDYAAINLKYWEKLERGEISREQVLLGRFEEFFAKYNLPLHKAAAFNDEYQIRLGDQVFFSDFGLEAVEALRGKVKQYAVTNGTALAQQRKLARSGLDRILDGIFISEHMGAEKPAKAFFERVFQETGTFAPDEAVIIGDSLTSDMRGGNNAGILNCWYNPSGKKNLTDVRIDNEIRSLAEVPVLIEKLS